MSKVTLHFSLAPGRGLSDSENGDARPLEHATSRGCFCAEQSSRYAGAHSNVYREHV